jgi:hypothetical protein
LPRPSQTADFNALARRNPYADPDVATRKIVELANAAEPYFDNRTLTEKAVPIRAEKARWQSRPRA